MRFFGYFAQFSAKNPFGLGETPPPLSAKSPKKSEFFLLRKFWNRRDPLSDNVQKKTVFFVWLLPLGHDLKILTTLVISCGWLRVHNLATSRFNNMQEFLKMLLHNYSMMKIVCGAQSDLLWFYSMFTICFCTPIWTGPPIKADVPTLWPHCVPHSQPISFTSQDGRLWRCLQAWHDPGWPKLGCLAQGNG